MLTLTRRWGEKIVIGTGPDAVTVTIVGIERGKVRLGIEAPKDVPVDRLEVREEKERGRERANQTQETR